MAVSSFSLVVAITPDMAATVLASFFSLSGEGGCVFKKVG